MINARQIGKSAMIIQNLDSSIVNAMKAPGQYRVYWSKFVIKRKYGNNPEVSIDVLKFERVPALFELLPKVKL